jgi:hypothetical protein
MSNSREDLLKKIQVAELPELLADQSSGRVVSLLIATAGIAGLLLALYFPGVVMILAATVVVGIAATMSVTLDNTMAVVKAAIELRIIQQHLDK